MLIHGMEAVEEAEEIVIADNGHDGQANRRIDRVASANPIPESEHVGGINAEVCDLFGIG